MNYSTVMKWVTAIAEGFLAIPLIGGVIVISSGYSALGVMFVLHAITLLLSIRDMQGKGASILGLVTSVVSAIPIIGWFMHLVTAGALVLSAITSRRRINI
ncbi:hypothetical protein FQ087_19870 [Sporosarcina sp. ANT_H38]|uniref:hypothetical protein n=1 Tax=Sporosarcina sp. ANT_H38 TaxID=2597358 RepID=UPI0011F0A536|nr:hypothetical protein [Sporosarcina sp. ANT_H38]KAA0944365.1 hypothetical protein FQ087_19870 [Sporosarcina sp. ANT_H38]